MFFYLGEKTNIIDEKIRVNRNKNLSWKYGYDEEHDVVVISRDGTLGEVFNVNGLNIGLPEKPKDEEIINFDKTRQNQKWEREELPKGLTPSTQHKFKDYIDREFDRREKGVWVYINGNPVFLAGVYYFFIQWIREGNKYPNFRIIQNELMLYWEACKADERCYGICFVKPRRFGWSALGFTELLEAGTVAENKLLGMMSKKGTDAKKIFNRMVRSFKRLPFFFMPELDGTSTPKSELIFAEQSRRRKAGEGISEGTGLDTTISWHNTEINAMDGDEIFRSVIDEIGKFPKDVPASEYWSIVQTSHTIGSQIVGKAMVGSTVNAMKKGGSEFKSIYDDSDPNERMESGETKSGLYRLFIRARYCLAGFFDQYGFSIVEDPEKPILNDLNKKTTIGSVTYLTNKLEALKGKPDKWNERLRQFPDSDRDAFRDEAGDCEFNLKKILEQVDYNSFDLNDKFANNYDEYLGNDLVERGNLIWKNGVPFTEVIWVPDPENGKGFVRKGYHPPSAYRNKKEMKTVNGIHSWTPMAPFAGSFGADPYNRDKAADGRGSKGTISGFAKASTYWSEVTDFHETCFFEYCTRARTVNEFFDDVIKCCVYWSMPVLGELSNEAFLTYLRDNGFRNFSLNNPLKKFSELSDTERKLGGAPPQDAKIADQQMYAVEAHIETFVGVAEDESERPLGKMGSMVFTRTLTQWKEVDLAKRTKYDLYISSSLALLANQKRVTVEKPKKAPFVNPLRRYNNDGAISTLIT